MISHCTDIYKKQYILNTTKEIKENVTRQNKLKTPASVCIKGGEVEKNCFDMLITSKITWLLRGIKARLCNKRVHIVIKALFHPQLRCQSAKNGFDIHLMQPRLETHQAWPKPLHVQLCARETSCWLWNIESANWKTFSTFRLYPIAPKLRQIKLSVLHSHNNCD